MIRSQKTRACCFDCCICGNSKSKGAVQCKECQLSKTRPPIIQFIIMVDGIPCRQIPLTRGQYAIVYAVDYDWLMQRRWNAVKSRMGYYVVAADGSGEYLHNVILNRKTDRLHHSDHRNRNGLDNRRCNLRPCTAQQNCFNRGVRSDNTSGFKGVSWENAKNRWFVRIRKDGKDKYLGRYRTAEEGALVYDTAAIELFGEFAVLNFPREAS